MKVTPITLRLPSALLKRIDKMKDAVSDEIVVNRTDLIRVLLVEAMDARGAR